MPSFNPLPEPNKLPPGFPYLLKGPGVWIPEHFADPQEYVITLDSIEIVHIERAVAHFKGLGVGIDTVCRDNFPLPPELSAKLKSVSKAVHNGRGFTVLRGLNPVDYSSEDNVIIYGGVTSYVAGERADMIHIYDRAAGDQGLENKIRFPPNEISSSMDFHTDVDAGDILSLYTLGMPKSGGNQRLVSFATVYNDLAQSEPETLAMLAKNWRYEMPSPNGVRVINRPIMSFSGGHLQINFATAFLIGSAHVARLPESPEIEEEKLRAINSFLACCKKHSLLVDQTYGDMLFVNNMSMLHARENFVDEPSERKCRHLLSVMLRDRTLAWEKPADVEKYIDEKFAKLNIPQFFGTVGQYEDFRDKFAMLRHD